MKTFLCSYWYHGEKWELQIQAESLHDANLRLMAINVSGRVDGELMASFRVPSWAERILMWFHR